MTPFGYSLVRLADGAETQSWSDMPNEIVIPEVMLAAHSPSVGWEMSGYRLVARMLSDSGQGQWQVISGNSVSFDGTQAVVTVSYADQDITARRASMKSAVMNLRDQKIDAGVTFNGTAFQTRSDDRENIAGAAQLASLAIMAGAQAGNLRWSDPERDFAWIADNNGLVTMDAQTVIGFAKAVAARKSACIFAAYAIKASIDAAADQAALDAIDIAAGWPA